MLVLLEKDITLVSLMVSCIQLSAHQPRIESISDCSRLQSLGKLIAW
jgi:hypothetical protein